MIQYIGDEKIAEDFPHGNQRKHIGRMYCKQCPSSLKLTAEKVSLTDPAKLYKSEIAGMDCPLSFKGYEAKGCKTGKFNAFYS